MKPVLLLVDLQKGFLDRDLVPSAAEVVGAAARLLNLWRDAGLPVVHVWTTVDRTRDNRMPHWKQRNMWKCEAGTESHATPAVLQPIHGEPVIHKAFFSGFSSGKLEEILKGLFVDTLVIAGVHVHGCVRATVLDGYTHGYKIFVAKDAVGSYDRLHGLVSERHLHGRACVFEHSRSILNQVLGNPRPECGTIRHVCPSDSTVSWQWPVSQNLADSFSRAKKVQPTWEKTNIAQRADFLRVLAAQLRTHESLFCDLLIRQIGKPIQFARSEVQRSIELLEAVAANVAGDVSHLQKGLRRRPLGVVVLVTPFNNPLAIPIGKLAPALLFGNAVIWKPSVAGSEIAIRVAELCGDLPAGILQVLLGDHETAVSCMEMADAVTLSGSPAAGRAAGEICTRRMIPLQAELGGNNAAIVWRDADLNHAAREIAAGAFDFAGQRCTATRRVILDAAIYDDFRRVLKTDIKRFLPGDPMDEKTRVGPVISAASIERLKELLVRAADSGCQIDQLFPDNNLPGSMAPVIVHAPEADLEIVQEESFGPILVVQKAQDWEHALALCNGVRQGLAAACFTKDSARIAEFLQRVNCGLLKINQSTAGAAVDLPFGGWKQSGIGPAEHGPANVEFFTRMQSVYFERIDSL